MRGKEQQGRAEGKAGRTGSDRPPCKSPPDPHAGSHLFLPDTTTVGDTRSTVPIRLLRSALKGFRGEPTQRNHSGSPRRGNLRAPRDCASTMRCRSPVSPGRSRSRQVLAPPEPRKPCQRGLTKWPGKHDPEHRHAPLRARCVQAPTDSRAWHVACCRRDCPETRSGRVSPRQSRRTGGNGK